jgi:hypothetical protein
MSSPSPPAPHDNKPPTSKEAYANERVIGGGEFEADPRKPGAGVPGFHITGKCPSCHHDTSAVCATEFLAQEERDEKERTNLRSDYRIWRQRSLWRDVRSRRRNRFAAKTQVTVARCACAYNHVPPVGGSPFGCGAEWLLQVRYGDKGSDGSVRINSVPENVGHKFWPAADAAAAAIPSAATTAQASAKSWASALSALIAVVGVSALLNSRVTVTSLSHSDQVWFGICAGIAVLADAVMLYQSDFAQFGSPRIVSTLRSSDLRNADLDPLIEAKRSVRRLQNAVWAAFICGTAALAATAILLFASAAPVAPGSKVTYKQGAITKTTSCGTVAVASAKMKGKVPATPPEYIVKAHGAPTERFAQSEVTTIVGC